MSTSGMKRIRYRTQEERLISVNEIVAKSGARYIVYIDLKSKKYIIRNLTSMRKHEGGEGINNLNVLKRKVKSHLQSLGVVFAKEVRNRVFGLCEKGHTQQKHLEQLKENKQ